MKNISLKWFVAAGLLFLLYQWIRTLRFSLLADSAGSDWQLFNTLCIHSFLNNTLPAGLGEAAVVFLLKKLHGLSYPSGAALLLAARFVDLVLFCVLFFVIGLTFSDKVPVDILLWIGGVLAVLIIALSLFRALTRYLSTVNHLQGGKLQTAITVHLQAFTNTIVEVSKRKIWFRLILYSMGMWFAMYLFFLTIIFSLGYALSWHSVLMLYLLILPINLLPIKGIGNFGTHEAAWFVALRILDLSTADSALLGFGSHILFLVVIVLTLLIPFCHFFFSTLRPKAAN
jgi:uncharacterized protein (TIRG00374 family)